MESYLQYRIERSIGIVLGPGPYRGLLPHQPLIYSGRGDGMSQNTKRRVLETGEMRECRACDSLQTHLEYEDNKLFISKTAWDELKKEKAAATFGSIVAAAKEIIRRDGAFIVYVNMVITILSWSEDHEGKHGHGHHLRPHCRTGNLIAC